jgi:hypothetical protein
LEEFKKKYEVDYNECYTYCSTWFEGIWSNWQIYHNKPGQALDPGSEEESEDEQQSEQQHEPLPDPEPLPEQKPSDPRPLPDPEPLPEPTPTTKNKRASKRKVTEPLPDPEPLPEPTPTTTTKNKRAPKRKVTDQDTEPEPAVQEQVVEPEAVVEKRGRGRPRKIIQANSTPPESQTKAKKKTTFVARK